MRYAAGHAGRTRERLLDLAADLLRRDGAERFGVQPLMRAAGLTRGGFYAHFASREALLAAALERAFADGREASGADTIERFVAGYLSAAHLEAAGCPLPALAGEARRMEGVAAARYQEGAGRLRRRLAGWLVGAVPDPDAAAASVLAELVGAVALARAAPAAEREGLLDASRRAILARIGR